MIWGLSWIDLAGITAGILIIGVGVFVLTAKPHATLNRLFFVLALMDGASTILFGLALVAPTPEGRLYFFGTYWYHYLAFIGLLALFGAFFPKPLSRGPLRIAAPAVAVGGTLAVILLFALDHGLFWRPTRAGPIPAEMAPVGNLVNIGFAFILSLLALRFTLALRAERSESHRRQGAYVLGGMALAYFPFPWTFVAQDIALRGIAPFVSGRWDRLLAHWGFAASCLAMVASAVILMRGVQEEARDERRFIFACYAAVLALGILGFVFPAAEGGIALRTLALLAYPVLLGWAIVRYEVFDIDRQLRRAATVSMAAVGLTVAFVLAENALENLLTSRVFGGMPSVALSGSVAALVTAFAFIPVARASRKAAAKIVPELSTDELHVRKLEIYRHSLAGALADGILREGESRTLAALRASLGITDADHQRLLREVAA